MTRDLTEGERLRLSVVQAHLAAVSALTCDPARIDDLATLLADDFTWQTPSTNPANGAARSRETYLAMLGRPDLLPAHERFVALEVRLLDSTVEGLRVAGETISEGFRQDGLRYTNRYHQLWRFDDDDRIVEYRIYADTLNVAAVQAEGIERIALAFIECLAQGDAQQATGLLADSFCWLVRHGERAEDMLDKAAALGRIRDEPANGLAALPGGVLVQDDRVAIETVDPCAGWRQIMLRFDHGRIVAMRDYRTNSGRPA